MERCSSCIMPASVPGTLFDEDGVCLSCRSYRSPRTWGEEALEELLAHRRTGPTGYDSIVPLSGGRDSSYVLYLAKRVHGLNPLAVNFDNEFRNPQAVTNIENSCRALGVDLSVVRSKRDAATKIVRANTKTATRLGLANMMMSLCRQCSYGYVSAAYREAERHNVPLILWGTSSAESTEEIEHRALPGILRSKWYRLRDVNFYKTEYFAMRQRMEFPVKGNALLARDRPKLNDPAVTEIKVFDYIPWERQKIKETIARELGWSKPAGHVSTWRTDCILHEVVNFFFVKTMGCTKDCWGYCNMINAGQMTRQEALRQEEEALRMASWERVEIVLREQIGLSATEIARVQSMQAASPFPKA